MIMGFLRVFKIAKVLMVLGTLLLLLFGFSSFGLGMDMNGQINCPFTGHSMSICKMNPMEHIEEWQNMFTTLPAKDTLSIFFVLVALLALRKLIPWGKVLLPQLLHKYFRLPVLDNFQIIHPLQEALAKGILNPKLF